MGYNTISMKKVFVILAVFAFGLLAWGKLQAAGEVKLYFFYGDGCPHCAKEEKFLEQQVKENPNLKIESFEVWSDRDNVKLMKKVGEEMGLNVSAVPLTIIGDWSISGYLNDQTTGEQIRRQIVKCSEVACPARVGAIREQYFQPPPNQNVNQGSSQENQPLPEKLNLPLVGEINLKNFSLPVLTIIIGALDGFNPCAMWVLLFLISLLLGMQDRRRMWLLGSVFIIASAAVYFVFMAAWLNLLLFIGFLIWVRLAIGLVALFSGGYNLREYFKNKAAACKVTQNEKRRRIFDKLKEIVKNKKLFFALAGIIILAFAVNLVELLCSAGLPAVYTQILAFSKLPTAVYYLYFLLYLFFFMLDDLLIFIIAMVTLKAVGVTSRFSRASNLIGGIIMLILGILMIFKPGWLMFG